MSTFWILILIAVVLLGGGWLAYGIWCWRERKLEEQMPRQRSERYEKATSSVADYAKKLAEYQPPKYKGADKPDSAKKPDEK